MLPNDCPGPIVALTTADPRFDPTLPVTVNGHRFEPAPTPAPRAFRPGFERLAQDLIGGSDADLLLGDLIRHGRYVTRGGERVDPAAFFAPGSDAPGPDAPKPPA